MTNEKNQKIIFYLALAFSVVSTLVYLIGLWIYVAWGILVLGIVFGHKTRLCDDGLTPLIMVVAFTISLQRVSPVLQTFPVIGFVINPFLDSIAIFITASVVVAAGKNLWKFLRWQHLPENQKISD